MRVTIFKNGEKPRYISVASYDHALLELSRDRNDFDLAIYSGAVESGQVIHEEIGQEEVVSFKQKRKI